jgi:hypothetical protein
MKRKAKTRRNYGQGDLFNFHGAFEEKKAAEAKERSTPGAFIKTMWYHGGPRWGVLTKANPRKKGKVVRIRKRNVEWGTYEKGIFHPWTRRTKIRRKPAKRKLSSRRKKNLELPPILKLSHLAVAYESPSRHKGQTCAGCVHFIAGKVPRCDGVKSPIKPRDWCKKFKRGKRNPFGALTALDAFSNLKGIGFFRKKKRAKKKNVRKRRRNYADAADLYTQFHGRGPRRVTDTGLPTKDYGDEPELAQLGKLVSLTFKNKKFGTKRISWGGPEAPDLASTVNGKQLYIVGGNQDLGASVKALGLSSTDTVDLGTAWQVEYFSRKGFDNYQPITYYHDLGEETGERPRLVYDQRRKRIHLVGGAYKVKPEGIVN